MFFLKKSDVRKEIQPKKTQNLLLFLLLHLSLVSYRLKPLKPDSVSDLMLFPLCCRGNDEQDLAQYVNEVKRDNETLREIDQYQKSIENLVRRLFFLLKLVFAPLTLCFPPFLFQNQALSNYGRPKGDGEVRVATVDKRAKQDR